MNMLHAHLFANLRVYNEHFACMYILTCFILTLYAMSISSISRYNFVDIFVL